jgi:hypothetical protein
VNAKSNQRHYENRKNGSHFLTTAVRTG